MKVLNASLILLLAIVAGHVHGQECPNAKVEQYVGGSSDCSEPAWNFWYYTNEILLPSRDPTRFYQMGPDRVYEMQCAPGTCFGQVEQRCVHNYDWKNPCTQQ